MSLALALCFAGFHPNKCFNFGPSSGTAIEIAFPSHFFGMSWLDEGIRLIVKTNDFAIEGKLGGFLHLDLKLIQVRHLERERDRRAFIAIRCINLGERSFF